MRKIITSLLIAMTLMSSLSVLTSCSYNDLFAKGNDVVSETDVASEATDSEIVASQLESETVDNEESSTTTTQTQKATRENTTVTQNGKKATTTSKATSKITSKQTSSTKKTTTTTAKATSTTRDIYAPTTTTTVAGTTTTTAKDFHAQNDDEYRQWLIDHGIEPWF